MEVINVSNGIVLSQNKFTKDLLGESSYNGSKKALTPIHFHLKLCAKEILLEDPTSYRSIVGKLNFWILYSPNLKPIYAYTKRLTLESTSTYYISSCYYMS